MPHRSQRRRGGLRPPLSHPRQPRCRRRRALSGTSGARTSSREHGGEVSITHSPFDSLQPVVLSPACSLERFFVCFFCFKHRAQAARQTDEKRFPGGSDGKESACNAGDLGSNPWLASNLLQYSCWESPWTEEPDGLRKESETPERLSTAQHSTVRNGTQDLWNTRVLPICSLRRRALL